MEHWGCITFYYHYVVADDAGRAVSTFKRRTFAIHTESSHHTYKVEKLIAHELVHQWIGNLITIDWWTDIWLQESTTTHFGMRFVPDQRLR
jgi:aminopeptidase N